MALSCCVITIGLLVFAGFKIEVSSSTETDCPDGTYYDVVLDQCHPCPSNMVSTADKTMCQCQNGYEGTNFRIKHPVNNTEIETLEERVTDINGEEYDLWEFLCRKNLTVVSNRNYFDLFGPFNDAGTIIENHLLTLLSHENFRVADCERLVLEIQKDFTYQTIYDHLGSIRLELPMPDLGPGRREAQARATPTPSSSDHLESIRLGGQNSYVIFDISKSNRGVTIMDDFIDVGAGSMIQTNSDEKYFAAALIARACLTPLSLRTIVQLTCGCDTTGCKIEPFKEEKCKATQKDEYWPEWAWVLLGVGGASILIAGVIFVYNRSGMGGSYRPKDESISGVYSLIY